MAHWGYQDSQCPPNKWGELFPIASEGQRQSPIDIVTSGIEKTSLPELKVEYDNEEVKSAVNNGHSATFSLTGGTSKISGGPLTGSYKLLQFHFHWGSRDDVGSEHTLDGKQFSAELHLVHQNEKYADFKEAIQHDDGLSVIGVFLQVDGSNDFKPLDNVVKFLGNLSNPNDTCDVTDVIDIEALLPEDREYAHYSGSLTTPTLNECVTWINMLEPVHISEQQIEAFRNLNHGPSGKLVDNFRPVQPICERRVEIVKQ